jgi:hypothetical protein
MGADFFFFFFSLGEFPKRTVFARLSRIEQIGAGPRARSVFEFDTVSAEQGERASDWIKAAHSAHNQHFGLLRLTTTLRVFSEFANDLVEAQPGFWYYLKLDPNRSSNGLRAWFAGLTANGFTEQSRGRVASATRLISSIDPAPRPSSLGAAAVPAPTLPQAIALLCRMPQRRSRVGVQEILSRVIPADEVLVHDVGQGSFVTLLRQGRPCLHFDVGGPTAFNSTGARRAPFSVDLSPRIPIVLSHWHWDHFHAALQIESLRRCRWIVPDQVVGPGAARLAIGLANARRLHVWTGGTASFRVGDIGQCAAVGRNGTGLAMRAHLVDGRNILLAGDADYDSLPFGIAKIDGLIATHHGGRQHSPLATPPAPNSSSSYVISYGASNIYGHPHDEALLLHRRNGWLDPVRTAYFDGARRGDRRL